MRLLVIPAAIAALALAACSIGDDGSGDVNYHGNPEVTQRVDGSGDLSRAG
jgi:hypothetical protein